MIDRFTTWLEADTSRLDLFMLALFFSPLALFAVTAWVMS